jgi:hypothetical protein
MDDPIRPVIIEPAEMPQPGDPHRREFTLYDSMFPREYRPRYRLADPTQILYYPHFSVTEVSEWLFARGVDWGRSVLSPRKVVPLSLPGTGVLKFRTLARGRSHAGAGGERRLTLADAERLAFALNLRGDIDGLVLQRAYEIIVRVAEQYRKRN